MMKDTFNPDVYSVTLIDTQQIILRKKNILVNIAFNTDNDLTFLILYLYDIVLVNIM